MKELSIEEKAKAYDDIIKKANKMHHENCEACQMCIEELIPELKESEDEKMRKGIIRNLEYLMDRAEGFVKDELKERIAWLEKQGQTFTKKDVDDAYLKGVCDAKQELEKQGEHANFRNKIQIGDKVTRNEDGVLVNLSQLNRVAKKQTEQKPVVIIPKFRVGDEIKTSNEESLTITKIDEKGYWSEDLFICCFDEECVWDLVEQKPANKVEPKFKVGDWIIGQATNNEPRQISEITDNYYKSTYGGQYGFSFEDEMHLWTIKDAKDGDVLKEDSCIFILKKMKSEDTAIAHCCLFDDGDFDLSSTLSFDVDSTHPATKEQYDQLEKAMVNAGYKWNKKERKLEKIEQKHTPKHKVGDTVYYDSFGRLVSFVIANIVEDGTDNPMYEDKEGNAIFEKDLIEQKPVWNDEDERIYQSIMDDTVQENQLDGKQVDRLRDIKYRYFPQPKQEWSEEDDILLNDAIYTIKEGERFENELKHENCHDSHTYQVIISWLKSLKDRVRPQPKQEWSDEDETGLTNTIIMLKEGASLHFNKKDITKAVDWLKSLRPQSQWKPSDKQMETLNKVIFCTYNANNIEDRKHIESLYNELKKLKG